MADSSEPDFQTQSDWQFCRPWFAIFYALRPAASFRALVLAALGLIGTIAGWRMCWNVFATGGEGDNAAIALPDPVLAHVKKPEWPWLPEFQEYEHGSEGIDHLWRETAWGPYLEPVLDRAAFLTSPFQYLFDRDLTYVGLAYVLICGIWALIIWSFFGGAITRLAALRLTRDELTSTARLKEFALARWKSYFSAPLFPLLGIAFIGVGIAVLGLFARTNTTALVTAVFWPLALVGGLLMTILLVGLAFGWPLMWATVSTEGKDAFDALSRAYAYVFQRPLLYIIYAALAAVVGGVGYYLVRHFASLVIHMTQWAAGWGAGIARIDQLGADGGVGAFASLLIQISEGAVMTLALAFAISYLWCAGTAIYLLLRRHVDAAELDEVYLDPQDEDYGLPSLEEPANESFPAESGPSEDEGGSSGS